MKTKTHTIRKEMAPILKQMIEDKKAMQDIIKKGGTLYDFVRKRNHSAESL